MKLYPYKIEDVEYGPLVSGVGYYGTGFWTGICIAFANFFGTKCSHAERKMNKSIARANEHIVENARGYDGIMCVSYSTVNSVVHVRGIAFKFKNGVNVASDSNIEDQAIEIKNEENTAKTPVISEKYEVNTSNFKVGDEAILLKATRVSEADPTIIPAGTKCTISKISSNEAEVSVSFGRYFVITVGLDNLRK